MKRLYHIMHVQGWRQFHHQKKGITLGFVHPMLDGRLRIAKVAPVGSCKQYGSIACRFLQWGEREQRGHVESCHTSKPLSKLLSWPA
jgi:hypothetical protein